LLTGAGNAAANHTAIQNALATCDDTHNVVNLPSGTYYVNGFHFADQGNEVLRGSGPNATTLIIEGSDGCTGLPTGICMMKSTFSSWGTATNPPSGNRQCAWTAGYAQGTATVTLNTCGGTPPSVGQFIILDQANDLTDNGGEFLCDSFTPAQSGGSPHCSGNDGSPANSDGRQFNPGSGPTYSQKQLTVIQSISGSGSGPYTVGIYPPVYFTNIASGNAPGAWWPGGQVQNDGLENMTIDATNLDNGTVVSAVEKAGCYHCWVKNVRSIDSTRAHYFIFYGAFDVIRDSYIYQSQSHAEQSYAIELESASGIDAENNIFQQVTNPIMEGNCSGCVFDYNLSLDNIFSGNYLQFTDYSHNAGNEFNIFEGNMFQTIWADEEFGSSYQGTMFRNHTPGWQTGKLYSTVPFNQRAYVRAFNFAGNVMGQAGYHSNYEAYATSSSGGVNTTLASKSIFNFGGTGVGETTDLTCTSPPVCDPLSRSTAMRWGNYDTVNAAVRWDSTEASPGAVAHINANFSSSYFNTLAHTLPASLFYNSAPSWWPAGKAWPPIGPDVSSGNVGTCSGGTYDGALATNASQCTGGTLATAWASHVTSIPALDCYLNVMGGPPDGSGSLLPFDANSCYAATPQGSVNASFQSIPIATAQRTAAQGQVLVCPHQ